MTTAEMIYSFKLKNDKLDNPGFRNLKLPQLIYILNEGMLSLIKKRYSGTSTTLRKGMEEIQKRKDEFQKIIVPDEDISCDKFDKNVFGFSFDNLKHEYMILARTQAFGKKDNCKTRALSGILAQSDDLNILSDSAADKSSFEWGECLFRLANNQLRFYAEEGMVIETARVDYVRYPKPLDLEGYVTMKGVPSTTVDCELPRFLHDDIVDEAGFVYASSFSNPDMQAKLAKMMNQE